MSTTSTGQGARRRTCSAIAGRNRPKRASMPLLPTTISSAPTRSATAQSASAGPPGSACRWTSTSRPASAARASSSVRVTASPGVPPAGKPDTRCSGTSRGRAASPSSSAAPSIVAVAEVVLVMTRSVLPAAGLPYARLRRRQLRRPTAIHCGSWTRASCGSSASIEPGRLRVHVHATATACGARTWPTTTATASRRGGRRRRPEPQLRRRTGAATTRARRDDPASETYRGTAPDSEPETQAMKGARGTRSTSRS